MGSLIIIKMPPTIILPLGVTQIFCTCTLGTDIYYEYLTPYSQTPLNFKLANLFKTKPYNSVGTPFKIKCDGIWNPRTLEPSASLVIQTADQDSCAIESVSNGVTVSMTSLPQFRQIIITNDNIFNGYYTTYTIDITPSVLFYDDDIFYLTFPPETTLPSNPSCSSGNLLSAVYCSSPSPNRLKIEFDFKIP